MREEGSGEKGEGEKRRVDEEGGTGRKAGRTRGERERRGRGPHCHKAHTAPSDIKTSLDATMFFSW
jgi:hypothetical protein